MKKQSIHRNPVVEWLLVMFLCLTSILAITSCYFAYQQKKAELSRSLDNQLMLLTNEFKDIKDMNWEIYLPITENAQNRVLIDKFFVEKGSMLPQDMMTLKNLLSQMAVKDKRIQWIAFYAPERDQNYIYIRKSGKLMELPDDFAYLEELEAKPQGIRDIYGKKECVIDGAVFQNIAIAGGTTARKMDGSILVGYDVGYLEKNIGDIKGLSTLQYCIVWDGEVIYCSESADEIIWNDFPPEKSGVYKLNGETWRVQVADHEKGVKNVFYMVKWRELFWVNNQWSSIILGIVVAATVLSLVIYRCMLYSITKEVNEILNGLTILGNDQLDYRISKKFHQPEMLAIAKAINGMAEALEDTVESKIRFEKLQAEAEFSSLQAKFNPHFLYNTLEIFRKRCYQNGDEETADMIAETAMLFRGFIGGKKFIPIREELSFCKRYLAIYYERYRDTVKIMYNVDTDVLQYGIIRNVFQPLIENYFEHGYDPEKNDNHILIKGSLLDTGDILFTVEDNGRGLTEQELDDLKNKLNKPISSERESYGLRNLHKRIKMFYGDRYGLNLLQNENGGFCIKLLIAAKNV